MSKVLIVDDEQFVIMGLQRAIKVNAPDLEVTFKDSALDALDILSKESFDIIVSDMFMPEMNGIELLAIVQDKYPDIIRIILSGYYENIIEPEKQKIADQFVSKPVSNKDFIEILRSHIAKRSTIMETV